MKAPPSYPSHRFRTYYFLGFRFPSFFAFACLGLASTSVCALLAVSSPAGSKCRWGSFSGPYSRFVGIRAFGWSKCFKECMLVSAEAKEIEEELFGV